MKHKIPENAHLLLYDAIFQAKQDKHRGHLPWNPNATFIACPDEGDMPTLQLLVPEVDDQVHEYIQLVMETLDALVSEATNNDACGWQLTIRMAHHEDHDDAGKHLEFGDLYLHGEVKDSLS